MKRDQVHERRKGQVSFDHGFIISHLSINVWMWSVFDPFNYKSVTFDCETMRFTWPNECKLWLESTITVFLTTNKVKFSSLNFISSVYLFPESISLIRLAGRSYFWQVFHSKPFFPVAPCDDIGIKRRGIFLRIFWYMRKFFVAKIDAADW